MKKDAAIGVIASGFTAIIVALICWLIQNIVRSHDYSKEIEVLFESGITQFIPESVEKLQYMISLISFPSILLLMVYVLHKLKDRNDTLKRAFDSKLMTNALCYTVVFGSILFIWLGFKEENFSYFKSYFLYEKPIWSIGIFALVAVILSIKERFENSANVNNIAMVVTIMIDISIYLIIVALSSMYLFDIHSVSESAYFTSHFNAVFHSVAAVISGKALLVDEINQYGLYPHFLEPIFALIKLSVRSFTLVFSILIMVTFICWYAMLKNVLFNRTIAQFGLFTVLFFGFAQLKLQYEDAYFQYYPIRTLFPALVLLLSSYYFLKPSKYKYIATHVITSLAVLWNPETGAVVIISWIGALIFHEITQGKKLLNWIKHIPAAIAIFACVLMIYSGYIWLRYGQFPNYLIFIEYIRYFYNFGMMMLPMPLIHPWNFVAIVYMAGIVISILAIYYKKNSIQNTMLFLVTIMGCGLFSYYQGRSHNNVLSLAWYPAFIVLAILIDRYWRRLSKKISVERIFLGIIICCMMFTGLSLFDNGQRIIKRVEQNWKGNGVTPIVTAADFIKKHTNPGEKQLILSFNSGVYYAESKTIPVVNVPGPSEILLVKDYQLLSDFILSRKTKQIFLDKNYLTLNFNPNLKIVRTLFVNYQIEDASEQGNMLRLVQREKPELESALQTPKYFESGNGSPIVHYSVLPQGMILDQILSGYAGWISGKLPAILLEDSFTIEAAVKPNGNEVPYAVIAGNHPGYNGNAGFVIQKNGDAEDVYMFDYGDGKAFVEPILFRLTNDEWNYLAITYENGHIKCYINNVLMSSVSTGFLLENSRMEFIIGDWIGTNRNFSGDIKEVKIQTGTMTSEEVSKNWERIKTLQ